MSKKEITKAGIIGRYVFAFLLIAGGIFLNLLKVGKDFLGFESVGSWLVFVGFIMLAIITISAITRRKRIVDERMEKLAFMASRVTFLALVFGAFAIMIIDGIRMIEIRYSLFMSYLIAFMMLIYFVAYKILEKYY